jgi:hypothetical protein
VKAVIAPAAVIAIASAGQGGASAALYRVFLGVRNRLEEF